MVRFYLLTERERNILSFFLDQDQKLEGFRELKHAIIQMEGSRVAEDLQLIKEFKEKLGLERVDQIDDKMPVKRLPLTEN